MRKKFAGLFSTVAVALALFAAPAPALALTTSPVDVSSAMRYAPSAPLGSIIAGLSNEDDDTESFQAPFEVNFFGTVYGGLCVTTNGGVYLTEDSDTDGSWTDESCSDYYDMDLENLALEGNAPMIAAMGNDQDPSACDDNTSDGFGVQCEIYYGTTTVDGRDAYAITWYRVPQYEDDNDSALSNTFQIVIIKTADWDGTANWDFDIEFNFGQVKDVENADGYDVDNSDSECSDAATDCRWAIGWADYTAPAGGNPESAEAFELFPDTPSAQLADGGATSLTANSLNSAVAGRYTFGQRSGVTANFSVPVLDGSAAGLNISSSSEGPVGGPGIFLAVAGPVGRTADGSPVYYGADRVAATSAYVLTVTGVTNIRPMRLTLDEGTVDIDASFSSMKRLPQLSPGVYNIRMTGTHRNGATLELTAQVTIGSNGEFTSIGDNVPIIR